MAKQRCVNTLWCLIQIC